MTTKNNETKSQTGEQSTFAPLGKYAVIAVIMVGIIVTTAIMLDKQLNKAETEIASIEEEVSKLNEVQAKETKVSQPNAQIQVAEQATTASATKAVTGNAAVVNSVIDSRSANNQTSDEVIASTEDLSTSATSEVNVGSHQARIDSHKAQQKTRMTEMFDRIATLESKQLEQFKTQQEEQVARLRNQVNVQQQQIDALIQRNENLFNLRTVNVQRNQAQREKMLNRI